jgi:hypothetical protein
MKGRIKKDLHVFCAVNKIYSFGTDPFSLYIFGVWHCG